MSKDASDLATILAVICAFIIMYINASNFFMQVLCSGSAGYFASYAIRIVRNMRKQK